MDIKFKNQRNAFVKKVLRSASLKWGERNEAKKKARVARGFYLCAECGPSKQYGPKEIHLDHIDPVVPLDNKELNWEEYIERLFCHSSGFQVICKNCHATKTLNENLVRQVHKKKNKKSKK